MEEIMKEKILKDSKRLVGIGKVNPLFITSQLEGSQAVREIYKLAIDNNQMGCEWRDIDLGWGEVNFVLRCATFFDEKREIGKSLAIQLSYIDKSPKVIINVVNSDTDLHKLNYKQLYSKDDEPKYSIHFSAEKFVKIENEEGKRRVFDELRENSEFHKGFFGDNWIENTAICEPYQDDYFICALGVEGILDEEHFRKLMKYYELGGDNTEESESTMALEGFSKYDLPLIPSLTFLSQSEVEDENYYLEVTPFLEDKKGDVVINDDLFVKLKKEDFYKDDKEIRMIAFGIDNFRTFKNIYHKVIDPDTLKKELLELVNKIKPKKESLNYDLFKEYLENELEV